MKLLKCLILIAIFFSSAISYAASPVGVLNQMNSRETFCPGADVDASIYISGQNQSFTFRDELRSTSPQVISSNSEVHYWLSDDNLLNSGCQE